MALTKEQRQKVMRAIGWKCQRKGCGKRINSLTGEIHHRDGNPDNNNISNLRAVCIPCHKQLSEAQRKRRARDWPF